jgi:integrase
MSVRKRKWVTKSGESRESWIVDYTDADGDRHIETFERKKDADARHAEVSVDVKAGTHIAPSKAQTVAEAGEAWLAAAEARGLERASIKQYREHLRLHIEPAIGPMKLPDVTVGVVRAFEDRLVASKKSPKLISMILTSLGGILADAQERGQSAKNAVRDLRRGRKKRAGDRHKAPLKVGVDIPTTAEVSVILAAASGRWRPLIIVAAFTGLRASELRGLRWRDVDLKANELHVNQRADRFNEIGSPKAVKSRRTVPFGSFVANTLKEWKLACPPNDLDIVFATSKGTIDYHANVVQQGLIPTVTKALGEPKYTGLHCFRHFYASWLIDRGLPPKVIQERLGHASITMTFDRYGHMFPKANDSEELGQAELAVVNATQTRHAG